MTSDLREIFEELQENVDALLRGLDEAARELGYADADAAVAEVERRKIAANHFAALPVIEPVRCLPTELTTGEPEG